jgi:FeS assembly SUF system regulator
MLRISKLTDYATVVLARLAAESQPLQTVAQLSVSTGVAAPTVSKILKQLHRSGLVESTRGQHGGYRLARAPGQISAAQIIDALEGPMALTECVHHPNQCGIESHCGVGRAWQQVSRAIYRSLQQLSLVELAGLGAEPVRFSALERRLGPLTGSRRES